ncbi:MAG: hypothetical protein ACI4VK_00050 [Candidatus Coproplasma sp.]
MEKSRSDILSELYAVRSVLSIVSQNEDEVNYVTNNEINPRERTIESLTRANTSRNSEIEGVHRYDCKKRVLEQEIRNNEATIQNSTSEISELKKTIRKDKLAYVGYFFIPLFEFYFLPLIIPFIICAAILIVVLLVLLKIDSSISIPVALSCAGAISLIVTIIVCIRENEVFSSGISDDKKKINDLNKKIASCQQKIIECKGKIQELEKIIAGGMIYTPRAVELRNEINKDRKEIDRLNSIINQKYQRIREIRNKSLQLISSARKSYQLIDFRDWKNIDLIIFYFETRRADTIKEALCLVDRERQNQSLLGALHMASEQICKTVNSSIAALTNNLEKALDRLNNTINSQNEETRIALGRNAETSNALLQQQNEQTAKLIQSNYSAQEMNRALLKKISTSSDRLVADMESQLRAQGISC